MGSAKRKRRDFQISGGGDERPIGVDRLVRVLLDVPTRFGAGVRATGAAGLDASAERLVDDSLDGARAATAFGAAAEAAINLLGISGKVFRGLDGTTDIMVAEDVTGTDNHETGRALQRNGTHSIFKTAAGCKRKNRFFK
jgi:hypothetical protein